MLVFNHFSSYDEGGSVGFANFYEYQNEERDNKGEKEMQRDRDREERERERLRQREEEIDNQYLAPSREISLLSWN